MACDLLFHFACFRLPRSIERTVMTRLSTSITWWFFFTDTFHLHPVTKVLSSVLRRLLQLTHAPDSQLEFS